ncbi:3-methylornithyl-N6-L-lysine dehydrogenase PylD [bacterium]|nr:3-methylornithyl-N6-L-lysine dehydrogenase PylD [bacterium]
MTRLKNSDICDISFNLCRYNRELISKTGQSLLGIACHACGVEELKIKQKLDSFCVHVVPVTTGLGVISNFSETVCAILKFLGFIALVSDKPDASGITSAFENKADAIMMADDKRFVGINLNTKSVVDNSEMTGQVFASAMDLMADGINQKDVLVIGCGSVGEAAARKLLSFNAKLSLIDINYNTAQLLAKKLSRAEQKDKIIVLKQEDNILSYKYILEATPSENTITDSLLSELTVVASPGVPLGVSAKGCKILNDHLIHDKLELGVAAMAVALLK